MQCSVPRLRRRPRRLRPLPAGASTTLTAGAADIRRLNLRLDGLIDSSTNSPAQQRMTYRSGYVMNRDEAPELR